MKIPFRPDPESVQAAQELRFDPPLNSGSRDVVVTLAANGVQTFESCEGGLGHSFPKPTVRFEGGSSKSQRAVAVAWENGLPVTTLPRTWAILDSTLHGLGWEMAF
jgi:hypothetical protein